MKRRAAILAVGCGIIIFGSSCLAEGFDFDNGWWNVELQGARPFGFNTIHKQDYYFTGFVEYEFPAWESLTVGLRGYPLLYFYEKYDAHGEENRIFGAGVGISSRLYWNKEDHDGLFLELASSPLLLSDQLEENSSSLVFMNEIGAGYRFPDSGWHLSVKFAHTSNANLGDHNRGVDAFVFGLGFRF